MKKTIIIHNLPLPEDQSNLINLLYFDIEFEKKEQLKIRLQKKIAGYKSQDIRHKKYIENNIISLEQLIEKLLLSKMNCYYCKQKTLLLYTLNRDPRQWTLDRLNNNKGHNNNNTVISCLKCNLKRRTLDDKKFLFTKQMKIIKKK